MPTCERCGGTVSRGFLKVFGDDSGTLHRCPSCDTKIRLRQGTAAGKPVAEPDPIHRPGRVNRDIRSNLIADGGKCLEDEG